MPLADVKYDLSHGFPADWSFSRFERRVIVSHLRDHHYDMVVNQTWGFLECENPITKQPSTKFKVVEYLVTKKIANKVLFFNFVDPISDISTWYDIFEVCKKANKNFELDCLGQVDSNRLPLTHPFNYWAAYTSGHFVQYTQEQTKPKNFNNLFLCYNRKPHPHRKSLHEEMIKHDVIHKGLFTLGNEDKDEIKMVNADHQTVPSNDKKIHGELVIPNDPMSLGDLEAWNSHLVTIVTETQHAPNVGSPFFSEKTWKPMIGMRPFILLGDGGSIKYLKDNGFYTFNSMFGITNDDATVQDIVFAMKNFSHDPADFYDSILPQLEHNRQRFFQFADEQKKIYNLPDGMCDN